MEENFDESGFRGDREREMHSLRIPHTRMALTPIRERNAPGSQAGKGPRSYQRPDETIYQDACEKLSEDPYIDASDIEVQVQGAEVILTGTVDSRETKRRTEDVLEHVRGVSHIENRLRVRREEDLRTKVTETFR